MKAGDRVKIDYPGNPYWHNKIVTVTKVAYDEVLELECFNFEYKCSMGLPLAKGRVVTK